MGSHLYEFTGTTCCYPRFRFQIKIVFYKRVAHEFYLCLILLYCLSNSLVIHITNYKINSETIFLHFILNNFQTCHIYNVHIFIVSLFIKMSFKSSTFNFSSHKMGRAISLEFYDKKNFSIVNKMMCNLSAIYEREKKKRKSQNIP